MKEKAGSCLHFTSLSLRRERKGERKVVCDELETLMSFSSVQLLSRAQLCNPMNCSTPGFPVHHQLPELAQTHVH